MVDPQNILTFPNELLIEIFQFCDIPSLGRLAQTCKRFRRIIYSDDSCWRKKCKDVICSNMFSEEMQRRSKPFLSSRQKCEISHKWVAGVNVKTTIVKYSRCLPWLSLEKDYLFCSKLGMIVRYPRRENGNVGYKWNIISTIPHDDDVSKFVINGDEIVSAGRDGTISRLSKSNFRPIHRTNMAHTGEIQCIDAKSDIIITGSRDYYVKIWKALPKNLRCVKELTMLARVLSVAIMPSNSQYLVGLPGTGNNHPLQLFDFENSVAVAYFGVSYRNGAGILDICPESENTVFACGYDTTVKLWDIRSPDHCVASWMDPYDNCLYCIQTDHNVTLITGSSRSSLVHVWDKRMPGVSYVHVYAGLNSPSYSIAFDASHLFIACDTAITQHSYL